MNNEIIVDDPLKYILRELELFEQTDYCKKYIAKKIVGIKDVDLEKHSEIASACFRQASEYFKAGNSVSLATKPLLYSYALNNYAKGMVYLTTKDDKLLNGFNKHGFSSSMSNNFLTSTITKKANGVISSLESLIQNEQIEANQNICLYELLSIIPGVQDIFGKITNHMSNVGFITETEKYYKLGSYITAEYKKEEYEKKLEYLKLYSSIAKEKIMFIGVTLATGQKIEKLKGFSPIYKDKIILPLIINNKPTMVQPMIAAYLIIMHYGMAVRYHAELWDRLIDAKISNVYSLIKLSIEECYCEFLVDLYKYLFDIDVVKKQNYSSMIKEYLKNNKEEIINMVDRGLAAKMQKKERGL